MEESNIWIASSDGNIQLVKEYLKSQSPDTKDETGYTPLHAASSYGHLDLIKLLILEYKANPNSVDNDGDCALHVASDLDSCKLLVELRADVKIRNAEGKLVFEY
jgi:ankyrin repeat protein